MKKIQCPSGEWGWQCKLQRNYKDFEEFKAYSDLYNLEQRLGFGSCQEAWDANPEVMGSTKPEDFGLCPVTATWKYNGEDTEAAAVNPGAWFGKAWLLSMPFGNFASYYIVEGDNYNDVIDEFSDSKYGHLIHVEDSLLDNYPEEARNYDGSGRVIDTDDVHIDGKEGQKLPFKCLYHGGGIPIGGVTPLEYSDLQNCPEEVQEFIAQLPGGLHHENRKDLIKFAEEIWEAAREVGNDKATDRVHKFYEEELGGNPFQLLNLFRDIVNMDWPDPELKKKAEMFINKARHFRDPRCHIRWECDINMTNKPTFVWHNDQGNFESINFYDCPVETQFTFQRLIEERNDHTKKVE